MDEKRIIRFYDAYHRNTLSAETRARGPDSLSLVYITNGAKKLLIAQSLGGVYSRGLAGREEGSRQGEHVGHRDKWR